MSTALEQKGTSTARGAASDKNLQITRKARFQANPKICRSTRTNGAKAWASQAEARGKKCKTCLRGDLAARRKRAHLLPPQRTVELQGEGKRRGERRRQKETMKRPEGRTPRRTGNKRKRSKNKAPRAKGRSRERPRGGPRRPKPTKGARPKRHGTQKPPEGPTQTNGAPEGDERSTEANKRPALTPRPGAALLRGAKPRGPVG